MLKNSKQAWDILTKIFASKTRARVMHLKERLSLFTKGSRMTVEYLKGIESMFDDLAVINSPFDDVDLMIHTLNGLGSEYNEVSTALCTRENQIRFEDLHDLLMDFENHLKKDEDPSPTASAHVAQKGKQTFHKRNYRPSFHIHSHSS